MSQQPVSLPTPDVRVTKTDGQAEREWYVVLQRLGKILDRQR